MVKAKKLKVTGRVQRVGYRRYILDLAQQEGVAGYVKNERDGSVTIFAQGDGPNLTRFVTGAKNPPAPAQVKELKELPAKAGGKQVYFTIRFGSIPEELQEGFGAMQTEFQDYREEFKDYREEFRDYKGEFGTFADRTDQNFKMLDTKYGEISAKPTNVLETLEKESVETRKELTRAVDNLARLVQEYVGTKD